MVGIPFTDNRPIYKLVREELNRFYIGHESQALGLIGPLQLLLNKVLFIISEVFVLFDVQVTVHHDIYSYTKTN